jgi:type I restriction enzyme S subunit
VSLVLSDHLPLLASAPDGIQKLRGLILELAVRGKLLPQDPSDEPASELLKRIAQERAHLEAKGVVKKSKAAPLVNEDEQPFSLPAGWKWVRLATIGNIFNGNSINSNEKDSKFRRDDGLPYIATKDVGYGLTPLDYENGVRIPELERNFKMARAGAVFICAEGGSAGKKCGLCDRNVFFGNKLFANEAFAGIPPRFVLYIYLSPFFQKQFSAVMTGIIGGVSIAKFVDIPIPLPPLAEQHRIVAKVNELMALCDRLDTEQGDAASAHARLVETLLGTLTQSTDAADLVANWQRLAEHFDTLFTTEASIDALKQTVLQLAVMGKLVPQDANDEPASELLKQVAKERARLEADGVCKKSKATPLEGGDDQAFAIPDTWLWSSLGSISVTSTGKTPATSKAEYYGDILPFIGPGQLTPAGEILPPEKLLSDVGRTETTLAKAGDILMVCIGGSIGKAAIANMEIAFNQQINCASPILMSSKYLYSAMTAQYFQKAVLAKATGSATPIINRSNWDEIPLPIPPLAEQRRIVAKVDELMALCDSLKVDLGTARRHQAKLADTLIDSALEAA